MESQAIQFCKEFKKVLDKICPKTMNFDLGIFKDMTFEDGSVLGVQRMFYETGYFAPPMKTKKK